MAIIIPSSKIFNKQSAKIRDNAIDRIEVNAIEISPKNEYHKSVLTTSNYSNPETKYSSDFKLVAQYLGAVGNNYQQFAAAVGVAPIFYDIDILIPIVSNNEAVSKVYYGEKYRSPNKEYDTPPEDEISATIQYKRHKGTKRIRVTYTKAPSYDNVNSMIDETRLDYVTHEEFAPVYTETEITAGGVFSVKDNSGVYEDIVREVSVGKEFQRIAKAIVVDKTNINTVTIKKGDNGYYYATVRLWVGGEYYSGSMPSDMNSQGELAGKSFDFYAEAEKIEPLKVELTIYGDTIGIELKDKTVYINGETSKNVYSVDKNEFLQTSNTIEIAGEEPMGAIEKLYGDTQSSYVDGKETAVIRCAIDNYYDSIEKSEGNLCISKEALEYDFPNDDIYMSWRLDGQFYYLYCYVLTTHNTDIYVKAQYGAFETEADFVIKAGATSSNSIQYGKVQPTNYHIVSAKSRLPMIFNIGDEVVPMVYSSKKGDLPMSTKGGKHKSFQVVGRKIGYDGEVYQELQVQEYRQYTAISNKLKPPTISLDGSILTIQSNDNRMSVFYIYVNGAMKEKVVTHTVATYNLAALNLSAGVYQITVVANGGGIYEDSKPSNMVEYVLSAKLEHEPLLTLRGNSLTITCPLIGTNQAVSSVILYANGEPLDTITINRDNVSNGYQDTTVNLVGYNLPHAQYNLTAVATAAGYVNSDESNTVVYTVEKNEQLNAPTISVVGHTLMFSNIDERATRFELYVGGYFRTAINYSELVDGGYDLYAIENLEPLRTYKLTATAVGGSGTSPSQESNMVEYIVPALATPTLHLEGNTLTITANDIRAKMALVEIDGYQIETEFEDGVVVVDLYEWLGGVVECGTITVKNLTATWDESEEVTVEYCFYDMVDVSGGWQFNETLPNELSYTMWYDFISNGVSYYGIEFYYSDDTSYPQSHLKTRVSYLNDDTTYMAYGYWDGSTYRNRWANAVDRVITFPEGTEMYIEDYILFKALAQKISN